MTRLRRALVFGASGPIGQSLLPLLREQGIEVVAITRRPHQHIDVQGVQWRHWDLHASGDGLLIECDAIFSLGPLDAFTHWQCNAGALASRVIAFSSTSLLTKSESPDPMEREVAQRLRKSEDALCAFGAHNGVSITLLRPTLIYGHGRDSVLSRIVTMARRWGVFVLPRSARGLRQPVHADDLASAALACALSGHAAGMTYALPGGETLSYRDMVARVLATQQPRPSLWLLPDMLFRIAVAIARQLDLIRWIGRGMLDRLEADLVFDASDAERDFGYAPRDFQPLQEMFTPPKPPQ